MRRLDLTRKPFDPALFRGKPATEKHFGIRVDEPALVYDGGKLVIAALPVEEDWKPLLDALKAIEYQTTYRTGGMKSTSRVVGFQPRITLRRDFCTAASLAIESPAVHEEVLRWARIATGHYARLNPELHGKQAASLADGVLPEWRLKGSVFTSGICNKSNALRYHTDSANFAEAWSAMYAFTFDIRGGWLSVPEYDLGLHFGQARLLLFDGQALMHGVTDIHRNSSRAYRYSCVFYAMKGMCKCLPADQELARIREVKTGREVRRTSTGAPTVAPASEGEDH